MRYSQTTRCRRNSVFSLYYIILFKSFFFLFSLCTGEGHHNWGILFFLPWSLFYYAPQNVNIMPYYALLKSDDEATPYYCIIIATFSINHSQRSYHQVYLALCTLYAQEINHGSHKINDTHTYVQQCYF